MNKEYHSKSNKTKLILLRDEKNEPEQVTKVGIVPFIPHEDEGKWRFMLMKPIPEIGHPGEAPEFQIAKGTRRINMGNGWCDMRDDDLINADPVFYENLIDTALREGHEEIGLKRSNVRILFDIGVFSMISARRNIKKPMHVFAAEIDDHSNFGDFEPKTAEVMWMTMDEFAASGRKDHVSILKEMLAKLTRAKAKVQQ